MLVTIPWGSSPPTLFRYSNWIFMKHLRNTARALLDFAFKLRTHARSFVLYSRLLATLLRAKRCLQKHCKASLAVRRFVHIFLISRKVRYRGRPFSNSKISPRLWAMIFNCRSVFRDIKRRQHCCIFMLERCRRNMWSCTLYTRFAATTPDPCTFRTRR